MVSKSEMEEIVQGIWWNWNFWEILRAFLRKSEKLKNPVFDKMANFSALGTCRMVDFWYFVGNGTYLHHKKIWGDFLGRKIKTWKNWKMKILCSAAPSQNFLKIPTPANFLDNFAPLMFSKLFSTVVFWCRKVPAKISTFFPFLTFRPQKDPQNGPESRKEARICDFQLKIYQRAHFHQNRSRGP